MACEFTAVLYAYSSYVTNVRILYQTTGILLTLPYLVCQAKKYNYAANGWLTRQKLIQKIQLPMIFPFRPCIFSSGMVAKIIGICTIMPMKATPARLELASQESCAGTKLQIPTEYVVGRHSNHQFAKEATEYKDPCARRVRTPSSSHQRRIDMSSHEVVYRLIPRPPVSAYTRTIPPLGIKFSITECHQFS